MSVKINPLRDRLVVKKLQSGKENHTASGIYVPGIGEENFYRGEIKEIGSDPEMNQHLKVGMQVMLPKHGGLEVKIDSEVIHIYHYNEIIGVLEA